jgi:hypothetical protein
MNWKIIQEVESAEIKRAEVESFASGSSDARLSLLAPFPRTRTYRSLAPHFERVAQTRAGRNLRVCVPPFDASPPSFVSTAPREGPAGALLLLPLLLTPRPCSATLDLTLANLEMVADRISEDECRRLVAALRIHTFEYPGDGAVDTKGK